jgi:hypothetical protein
MSPGTIERPARGTQDKVQARRWSRFQCIWRPSIRLGLILLACVAGPIPSSAASKSSSDLPKVPCRLTQDDSAAYITVLKDPEEWPIPVNPESIEAYTIVAKVGDWNAPLRPLGPSAQTLLAQASDETRAEFVAMSTKSCHINPFRKRDLSRTTEADAVDSKRTKRRAAETIYWSGVIQLSRIGFNSIKDEALVYLEAWCGGLCGGGDLFLLRKKGDSWSIIGRVNLWVS